MKAVEAVGKTVAEAIQKALEELVITPEEADVEILSEATAGLFGLIGSKQARVRVTKKILPEKYLEQFMHGIMERMGVNGIVELQHEDEILKMNVTGKRMGMLIGKRGQTLNALQYLLNVASHKQFPGLEKRLVLDVEGYREKREETLRNLAKNLAHKVTRYNKEVVLEPMSPQERRIIHTALQGNPAVATYSQGEEPFRKVVIAPK